MDDNQITDNLRSLTFAEPPLGFDPEEVATKAAKRIRNRRASVGVAVATLAVIGGAAIFVAPWNNQKQSQPAAPSITASNKSDVSSPAPTSSGSTNSAQTESDPKIPVPCQVPPPGKPRIPLKVDVTAKAAPNRKHLQDVLATMLPEAKDLTVSQFVQGYDADILTAVVCFRDSAGPATFNLTIAGPIAWSLGAVGTMSKTCGTGCKKISQADGSTVAVDGNLSVDPNATGPQRLLVAHYRADHTTVNVMDDTLVPALLAHDFGFMNPDGSPKILRSAFPLTEQQAIALATDPAFNVK